MKRSDAIQWLNCPYLQDIILFIQNNKKKYLLERTKSSCNCIVNDAMNLKSESYKIVNDEIKTCFYDAVKRIYTGFTHICTPILNRD